MTRSERLAIEATELAEELADRLRCHVPPGDLERDALRLGLLVEAAAAADKAGE